MKEKINVKEVIKDQFFNYNCTDALTELLSWSASDLKLLMSKLGQRHSSKETSIYIIQDLVRYTYGVISFYELSVLINKTTII